MDPNPLNTRQKGAIGEQIVADWLQAKGFKILDMNFNCRTGELDIVAIKDDLVAMVEVKSREEVTALLADLVPWRKQQRIISAARFWLAKNQIGDRSIRFDVAIVEGDLLKQYIPNAFAPDY